MMVDPTAVAAAMSERRESLVAMRRVSGWTPCPGTQP
jgi:hypothetical protein